jgi:hypothetical protein
MNAAVEVEGVTKRFAKYPSEYGKPEQPPPVVRGNLIVSG